MLVNCAAGFATVMLGFPVNARFISRYLDSPQSDLEFPSLDGMPTLRSSVHSGAEFPILNRELRVWVARDINQVGQRADLTVGWQNAVAVSPPSARATLSKATSRELT